MEENRKTLTVSEDTSAVIALVKVPEAFTDRDVQELDKSDTHGHSLYLQRHAPEVVELDTVPQIREWLDAKVKNAG